MTTSSVSSVAGKSFIVLSSLALASVSFMALTSPQSVMDLVKVKLENTDAVSSIRGIYGGLGLAIIISLVYMGWKDTSKALAFLSMLWGFYALSRLITLLVEGPLGAFGNQWMVIESIFCVISLGLLYWSQKTNEAR